MQSARSSGDMIADRRFAHALAYRAEGDLTAAADLMTQALERVPDWAAGWLALGETLEAGSQNEAAIAAYEKARALDPADRVGAGARLARLGARPAEGAVTPAHVAALFDDYAPRFERALVETLHYRAPALLRTALDGLTPRRFTRAIDLGCGTGLAAEAIRDRCHRIDGVDLSANMLAMAAAKGLYTQLEESELVAWLARQDAGSADLILAADVLVYMGDLAPLFGAAARVLAAGGLFAFTVQDAGEDAVRLGADLRYAHGEAAIRRWAAGSGFRVATMIKASTRQDAGVDVAGLVAVLENPDEA